MPLCFWSSSSVHHGDYTEKFSIRSLKRYDDLNASVQENVSAIRVVKAFVREDYENVKFSKASKMLYDLSVKAEGLLAFNNPAMMVAVYFCIISVSWFGAQYIVGGSMTTGDLTSLFSYIMSLLMSLMMLSMVVVMISMSLASIRRISEVLNEKADLGDPENPVMEVPDGGIDFNHVNFSYKHGSGEKSLSDIDLHIASGETIGVIGGTGAGKSTLVNLICRLYDVDDGSVCVGGVDVRKYDTEVLRNQVSVVLQKNTCFRERFWIICAGGNPDATDRSAWQPAGRPAPMNSSTGCRAATHTMIQRGGSNVSGGTEAASVYCTGPSEKARVLILDDSTSAVDTATDAKIRAAFAEQIPGTTKIIIAQRISSVQSATGFWCWTTAVSTPLIPMKICWRTTPSIRKFIIPRWKAAVTSTSPRKSGRRKTDLWNKKQSRPEVGIATKLIKRVIRYMLHYYKIPFLFVIACILITAIATVVGGDLPSDPGGRLYYAHAGERLQRFQRPGRRSGPPGLRDGAGRL